MVDVRASVAILAGALYGTLYLWMIGDVDSGGQGWHWQPVSLTLERIFSMRGLLHFEAIALAEAGPLVVLVSPGNIAIAALLSLLLAVNIDGALDLRRQAVCSTAGSDGVVSASLLPALLAGGACCAPSLLILLGIPGLGAFVGLFAWMIPLSVAALIASRWWQRRRGARAALGI